MKNNLINIKIEFENQPMINAKGVKNITEFDDIIGNFRTKIFGGKK